MKTIRSAVVAVMLAGALAACTSGGEGPDPLPSGTPSAPPSSSGAASGAADPTPLPGEGAVGPEEAAVETALRAYQGAIAVRDFPIACTLNAPETSEQLVALVQAQGAQIATCEEAFTVVFDQPGAIEVAAESAATTTVQDVTIEGENATIRWTSQVQGQPSTVTNTLRAIDGQWRLVGTV